VSEPVAKADADNVSGSPQLEPDPITDAPEPNAEAPLSPPTREDSEDLEATASETRELEDPLADLIASIEAERDGYLVDLQRVAAEFANFKKQAKKRITEVGSQARAELAEKLLPVLDACDLAVEHGADDVMPIQTSLVHALEPIGLEVLDPAGDLFDPNKHEAVLHEPVADEDDEDGDQVVIEVLRRGYAWEGRVLRPAMVRVRG